MTFEAHPPTTPLYARFSRRFRGILVDWMVAMAVIFGAVFVAQSGGNVSFPKACGRLVIKGLLGWYSFVILAATRRNQAVHDLLTRSTVQIRSAAKARPGQYIAERVELSDSGLPSRLRRAAIIGVYLLLLFAAFEAVS